MDYIVFDGKDCILEDNFTLKWQNIQQSIFNNQPNNKQLILTPIYLNFSATFDVEYSCFSKICQLESNLRGINVKQSNILCLAPCLFESTDTNIVQNTDINISNPMPILVQSFSEFTIKIKYMDGYLTLSDNYNTDVPFKNLFKIIFKITYV